MVVVETRCARCWLRKDGIFQSVDKGHVKEELEDTYELLDACKQLCGEQKVPMLADSRKSIGLGLETQRAYNYDAYAKQLGALALIVRSNLRSLFFNLLLLIRRPSYPIRYFTSERDALRWLNKHAVTS